MPELPEVETVVRNIENKIAGQSVLGATVLWHKTCTDSLDTIIDNKIISVSRRGKYIIVQFLDNYLVVHLRMTGKFFLIDKKDLSKNEKHLRFFLELENKYLVFVDQRKFGRIQLCKDLNWLENKLGPEPLSKKFTVDALAEICNSKRQIKVLLLDQSKVAGLGNIYVDEVLWHAGVHPKTVAQTISLVKIKLMHKGIVSILSKAIENQGTTFQSYTFEGNKKGSFATELKVFNRAKALCYICNTPIIKMRVGQRGTYVCEVCQVKT